LLPKLLLLYHSWAFATFATNPASETVSIPRGGAALAYRSGMQRAALQINLLLKKLIFFFSCFLGFKINKLESVVSVVFI
jgi:hypothetical protein